MVSDSKCAFRSPARSGLTLEAPKMVFFRLFFSLFFEFKKEPSKGPETVEPDLAGERKAQEEADGRMLLSALLLSAAPCCSNACLFFLSPLASCSNPFLECAFRSPARSGFLA